MWQMRVFVGKGTPEVGRNCARPELACGSPFPSPSHSPATYSFFLTLRTPAQDQCHITYIHVYWTIVIQSTCGIIRRVTPPLSIEGRQDFHLAKTGSLQQPWPG